MPSSQAQLHRLRGLRVSLHRTEIGLLERAPRIDTLVAAALAIAPDELIRGIEWTPDAPEPGAFTISPPGEDRAPSHGSSSDA
jgi:hypothetical protein